MPGDVVTASDFVKLNGKRVVPPPSLLAPAGPPPSPNRAARRKAHASTAAAAAAAAAKAGPTTGGGGDTQHAHHVYLVYHKPAGVECTTDVSVPGNVVTAVGHPRRIFPVGRLDKDTTGVLLLTSDGRLPNACLRATANHAKVYEVTCDRPVSDADRRKLSQGVVITTTAQSSRSKRPETKRTLPCKVHPCKGSGGGQTHRIEVTLTEGRNRQVRKMLRAAGHRVTQLHRAAFMGVGVRGLKPGAWRPATPKELQRLLRAVADHEAAEAAEAAAGGGGEGLGGGGWLAREAAQGEGDRGECE